MSELSVTITHMQIGDETITVTFLIGGRLDFTD